MENLESEQPTGKELLGYYLRRSLGLLAVAAATMAMPWEKMGDPLPKGVKPGWDVAREKEFEMLRRRDALNPRDFPDEVAYRRSWVEADHAAQEAWRERLELED